MNSLLAYLKDLHVTQLKGEGISILVQSKNFVRGSLLIRYSLAARIPRTSPDLDIHNVDTTISESVARILQIFLRDMLIYILVSQGHSINSPFVVYETDVLHIYISLYKDV